MQRTIKYVNDVKDLSELLSGASVDEARLVPTPVGGRMQLVVELTRAMVDQQTVVRRGLFRRTNTPWTKCQLTFNSVRTAMVKRTADVPPDQIPLFGCEAVHGGYQLTVQAPDGLRVMVGLDQLDGAFADVGSPIESP